MFMIQVTNIFAFKFSVGLIGAGQTLALTHIELPTNHDSWSLSWSKCCQRQFNIEKKLTEAQFMTDRPR